MIAQAGVSSPCYDADFYPFGGEVVVATNTCSQNYKFTGKERETESGLDNFGARFDASNLGRFTSVDPVEITLGRLQDPQQLNLYSYARNNPLRFVDPNGEALQLSGDVKEAQAQLCELIGGDCQRISFDQKTNTITVDLNGIDLSLNEGASLLNDVVSSSKLWRKVRGVMPARKPARVAAAVTISQTSLSPQALLSCAGAKQRSAFPVFQQVRQQFGVERFRNGNRSRAITLGLENH